MVAVSGEWWWRWRDRRRRPLAADTAMTEAESSQPLAPATAADHLEERGGTELELGAARTPVREADSPDSGFTPSVASTVRSGGEGLEQQLAVLQKLHSSGLLDGEVFARQQDSLLAEWRHSNHAGSVFDRGASQEIRAHCQRYAAPSSKERLARHATSQRPGSARSRIRRAHASYARAFCVACCSLRTALEQRLASAKSRQSEYASGREASATLEISVEAEASAHRETVAAVFRDARDALQRKEQDLVRDVELRRDSALHSLAAQQEELADSLAQHSESAALIRTALHEDDPRSFIAGYAQLCARLETEEVIAESLYEARTTAPDASHWYTPGDLVNGTVDAAIKAAGAVGFDNLAEPLDRWAPPPVVRVDEETERLQGNSEEATVRRRAAEGDAESLYILGGWLQRGTGGFPSDRREAETRYRQAASQGHPEAACALGCMLIEPLSGSCSRHSREHSVPALEEALALLRQAADAGVLEAHYNLGWILSGGLGLGGEDVNDNEQAIEHYRVAAHGGDGLAQLSLGNLLADSMTAAASGGDDDDARAQWSEAIDWWKQALEDSEVVAEAAFRLGCACEREAEMLAGEGSAAAIAEGNAAVRSTPDDKRLISAGMQQALDYYRQAEGAGHPVAGKEVARLAALPLMS